MRHLRRWYVYLPITALIVGLLLWRTQVWTATDLLRGADVRLLVVVVLLNLVVIVAWAVRSRQLLDAFGHHIGTLPLVPIVSFANTINGLTPASAGEVVRAVVLRQRHDVPYRDGAAIIVVERVFALGLIVVSALACLVIAAAGPVLGALAVIVAVVLVAVPTVVYRVGYRFSRIFAWIAGPATRRWALADRAVVALADIEDQVATILASWSATARFTLVTALIFVTMDAQLVLVGAAIGVPIDPIVGWAALGLGAIAGILSALPFGLGAADAVIAIVLISFGTDPGTAALLTVLLRLLATLPTGLFGAASYVYLNRTSGTPLASATTEHPG